MPFDHLIAFFEPQLHSPDMLIGLTKRGESYLFKSIAEQQGLTLEFKVWIAADRVYPETDVPPALERQELAKLAF